MFASGILQAQVKELRLFGTAVKCGGVLGHEHFEPDL